MRHILTLSLVFFSLTQLARAERVEGYRLLTKQYCDKQQVSTSSASVNQGQPEDPRFPFFLSYSELTAIGVQPQQDVKRYCVSDHIIVDLTITDTPKNNSP
ncbi:hypothetical protein [Pedobacter metabolipauper]|uniref:Uncharacterized protein n=1 Tax=Pedobacter metabolipauper TaxID=425513 RepID=A0A4R6SQI0_9SPHI|nr:hypothetical protein [Pedobacter metabolipauper]TDQ06550.1 hypothetical protein ATK78_4206 [Pedobacter metabolipauper]